MTTEIATPPRAGPTLGRYAYSMWIRRGTVRTYLEGLRGTAAMAGATGHTYCEPLVRFLHAAAKDLELGDVTVHGELRLADVGQPDLYVVNADGTAIGYDET